jgi:hypothetical protein
MAVEGGREVSIPHNDEVRLGDIWSVKYPDDDDVKDYPPTITVIADVKDWDNYLVCDNPASQSYSAELTTAEICVYFELIYRKPDKCVECLKTVSDSVDDLWIHDTTHYLKIRHDHCPKCTHRIKE